MPKFLTQNVSSIKLVKKSKVNFQDGGMVADILDVMALSFLTNLKGFNILNIHKKFKSDLPYGSREDVKHRQTD